MESYQSPLVSRYASPEMSKLFSPHHRATTWRKVWVALAKAEQEQGLSISDAQIDELASHIDDVDLDSVALYEKDLRHDVMAHIHAYGDQCPGARAIIHLGATSCTITDNGDCLQFRDALTLLIKKLVQVIKQLAEFSDKYKAVPCLAFTHYQPAQLTTVGKRASLWLQDLLIDLHELENRYDGLTFLGVKGTTGTQASFLELLDGDHDRVEALDQRVGELLGFSKTWPVSGQTYPRKQDMLLLHTLSGIAASAHKFGTDLRLLSNLREVEEPFETNQVGSSAMPYKRNPMRSERVCSLARFVMSLGDNPQYTAATQWLERTLDDSANRRLAMAESFLATDGVLNLLINITQGLVVKTAAINRRNSEELPFMATENLLMRAVKEGGDRQELHEVIRRLAFKAREEGASDQLLMWICEDGRFPIEPSEIPLLMESAKYIGRSPEQVDTFLQSIVRPAISSYEDIPAQLFTPQV